MNLTPARGVSITRSFSRIVTVNCFTFFLKCTEFLLLQFQAVHRSCMSQSVAVAVMFAARVKLFVPLIKDK
jgi:hypothetical protein